jgi:hypothetical protein
MDLKRWQRIVQLAFVHYEVPNLREFMGKI